LYFVIDAAVDFAVDVDFVFDVTSPRWKAGGLRGAIMYGALRRWRLFEEIAGRAVHAPPVSIYRQLPRREGSGKQKTGKARFLVGA